MNLRRLLLVSAGTCAGLLLFMVLTICFIPTRQLQDLAVRAAQQQGFTLRMAGFGKTLLPGLKATEVEVGNEQGPLLKARNMHIHLRLLPLLSGRLALSWRAAIGPGQASGEFAPRTGDTTIFMSGIPLEQLPFIQTLTGAHLKGTLLIKANLNGKGAATKGEMQVEVTGASLAGLKIGGLPLPDADYRRVQGMLKAGGGMVTITSFTLEGDSLYARLKGDFPVTAPLARAPLNLTLELMPKPDFMERQKYIFLLLVKYMAAPGHYQLPITGTLGSPRI